MSLGNDLCDKSAPGLRVDGPRAPLLGTDVLTRGQRVIFDAALGGSLPTQALPAFQQTLLVQASPTPATLDEARASPKAAHWDATINVELGAMDEVEVWHLAVLLPGSKIIKHNGFL